MLNTQSSESTRHDLTCVTTKSEGYRYRSRLESFCQPLDFLSFPGYTKEMNVWMEGYIASGDSAPPSFFGSVEAATLAEAVQKLAETKYKDTYSLFNFEKLTYWACRLYDIENPIPNPIGRYL